MANDYPVDPITKHHGFGHDAVWPHGDKPRRVHSGELPPARLEAVPEYMRSNPPGMFEVKVNNRGEVERIVHHKPRQHQHWFADDMKQMTNTLRDGSSPGPDEQDK
jgi:hypothetical protein